MNPIHLSEAVKCGPGTVIPGVKGTVSSVCEYNEGDQTQPDKSVRHWSLQSIIIEQDATRVPVQLVNKPRIMPDAVGRGICLLAHEKTRGGLSGLKVELEGNGKILRVSSSGEVVLVESAKNIPASTGDNEDGDLGPVTKPHTAETVSEGTVMQHARESRDTQGPSDSPGTISTAVARGPWAPEPVPAAEDWLVVKRRINQYWELYQTVVRRVVKDEGELRGKYPNTFNASQAVSDVFGAIVKDLDRGDYDLPQPKKISPPA